MLLALTAVCLALLVYPYLVYPFLLRWLPQRPMRKSRTDKSISLLFCAYNESASLGAKLDNLRKLKGAHPELEILAYDDGSSDDTAANLARHPELVTLVRGPGRSGKAAGMKRLAAIATGDILVFTDANVLCAPDALDRLLPYYGDPEVGGVCGTLRYENPAASTTAQIGADYWSLDENLRSLESATGNVMGADGSIFSVRRDLYPSFPNTLLDDFTVSMSVIFSGHRLVKAPDVLAYENSVTVRREELRRKIRIGARAWHTHAWMRGQLREMSRLDRFKYVSHKLLRWFGGAFLLVGLVSGMAALALISAPAFLIALTSGVLTSLFVVRARTGPIAKLAEIVLSMLATLAGVINGMRGRTVVTWTPAKSR